MNKSLLEQLAPTIAPESVSIWPLAPGWYLVALLFISLLLAALLLLRRQQKRRYRRLAQKQIGQLASDHAAGRLDTRALARAYNRLLKQICLQQLQLTHSAPLVGQTWATCLQARCPEKLNAKALHALCHYVDPQQKLDARALTILVQKWVKHHV